MRRKFDLYVSSSTTFQPPGAASVGVFGGKEAARVGRGQGNRGRNRNRNRNRCREIIFTLCRDLGDRWRDLGDRW